MAHPRTEQSFHTGAEGLELLQRYKGLYRPGEAAAMDPDGACAVQQLPAQGQNHRNRLLAGVRCGPGILKVQGGGEARGVYQGQEACEIAPLQCLRLLNGPAVIVVEVQSPEDGPVAHSCRRTGRAERKSVSGTSRRNF